MTPSSPVRRRHVFYVCGFDPNGPSRYHKLYSDGARQASAAGEATIDVGPRTRVDPRTMAWKLRHRQPGPADASLETQTEYVFPRWDDIIRDYWWQAQWPQVTDLLKTSWLYLRTGALWRIFRQSRGVFTSSFAPFFLLVVMIPGAAAGLWALIALGLAWRSGGPLAMPAVDVGLAATLGAWWAYWARRYWKTQWILRSYAFAGRLSLGRVPELGPRLDAMAAEICRQAKTATDDEILVVGHSLGTVLSASVLARAFRQDPDLARHGPAIGLLTLGHCTPLLSNLPGATDFRADLAVLAQRTDFCWVDFSDPMDDYAFPGVDPLRAAGVQAVRPGHPQMKSPHFERLFAPGPDRMPAMNQHEIHQEYLRPARAAQAPGGYDFFAITAGPLRLAERYSAPETR